MREMYIAFYVARVKHVKGKSSILLTLKLYHQGAFFIAKVGRPDHNLSVSGYIYKRVLNSLLVKIKQINSLSFIHKESVQGWRQSGGALLKTPY